MDRIKVGGYVLEIDVNQTRQFYENHQFHNKDAIAIVSG